MGRTYATSTSWENQQSIKFEDGVFKIKATSVPLGKTFDFILHPDGKTQSKVDLGPDLGGMTDGIAEIKGNSLITYLKKESPDVMIYETKLFPSEVAMTSTYHRQSA